MKPGPANPNDLRTPDAPKTDAPKENYNPLGIVVTTVIATTLFVGTMWSIHQRYLKNQIVPLNKKLEESDNSPGKSNTNS